MHPARSVLLAFLTVTVLSAQNGGSDSQHGLTILQQMSDHANAKSWYIESTEERTSHNEYSRDWSKTVRLAAVSENKYRYEGHSGYGSTLHISDGKTAWDMRTDHSYTQGPAPADTYHVPKEGWGGEEQAAMEAVLLRKRLADFAKHYISATRLPDETITQAGTAILCYVVRVTSEQRKGPKTEGLTSEETLWIDKATGVVRKSVRHENTFMIEGSTHIPLIEDSVTTYSRVELNSEVPESLLQFVPPADAKLVPKFDDGIFGPTSAAKLRRTYNWSQPMGNECRSRLTAASLSCSISGRPGALPA